MHLSCLAVAVATWCAFGTRISHIYLAEDVPLVFLPASEMPGSPMGAEQEGFGKSILVWIDARKKRISSNCSRVLFVEIVSLGFRNKANGSF